MKINQTACTTDRTDIRKDRVMSGCYEDKPDREHNRSYIKKDSVMSNSNEDKHRLHAQQTDCT